MNILVTGGTGSLGTSLSRFLLTQGHNVAILSRNAHRQADLFGELADADLRPRMLLGDVCDPASVRRALKHQDVIIHAAANKRVERGESDPGEYIRVNIIGSMLVADAAAEAGIPKCLFISTDKAASPSTQYGMTKAVAEHYWNSKSSNSSYFASIRYGNVVESNGSVWHLWQKQKRLGRRITVREPEPTRYILSLNYALCLIEQALEVMELWPGGTFVPGNLVAFSVWDLARQIEPDMLEWDMSTLSLGEKQHESLLSPGEEARQVSPDLWRIIWSGADYEAIGGRFCSATAKRISGAEVAEILNGNHSRTGL